MGTLAAIDRRWNWRLSAHCRAASLVSLWAFLFAMGGPTVPLLAVGAVRGVLSLGQSGLNIRLGRRDPLPRQTRVDWMLIGLAVVATEAVSAMHEYAGLAFSPLLLLPVVAPFSVLQFRIWRRSMVASAVPVRQATIIRLERFGSRARAA